MLHSHTTTEEDDIWVELMQPGKPKIEFENDGKDVSAGTINRLIERLTHETTFGILTLHPLHLHLLTLCR